MPNSPSTRYTYVTTWYTFLIKLYYNMELCETDQAHVCDSI